MPSATALTGKKTAQTQKSELEQLRNLQTTEMREGSTLNFRTLTASKMERYD